MVGKPELEALPDVLSSDWICAKPSQTIQWFQKICEIEINWWSALESVNQIDDFSIGKIELSGRCGWKIYLKNMCWSKWLAIYSTKIFIVQNTPPNHLFSTILPSN